MPLSKCPKCGHRRFDPWADACERRACGYAKPAPAPAAPGSDTERGQG